MHPLLTSRTLLLTTVLLLCQASAFVQAQSAQPASNAPFRFELTLKVVAPSMMVTGRAISFDLRFHNDSDKVVFIPWGSTLYDDLFEFALVGPDGRLLTGPTERFAPVLSGPTEFVRVDPKKSVTYSIVLGGSTRNGQQWYFRRPGEYAVRAVYRAQRDRYLDVIGKIVRVNDAWTGSLQAPLVRFTLTPGPTTPLVGSTALEGQVVDSQGTPVANAEVQVTVAAVNSQISIGDRLLLIDGDTVSTAPLVDRVSTDADGMFSFDGLPSDATRFTLKARHPLYPSATLDVANAPGVNKPKLKLTLPKSYDVRGRVVDPQGAPIVAAEVRNTLDSKSVFTDDEGRFIMPGVRQSPIGLQVFRADFGTSPMSFSFGSLQEQTVTLVRRATPAPTTSPRGARAPVQVR